MIELMAEIRKTRAIGNVKIKTTAKRGKGFDSLMDVSSILPDDWVNQSNAMGLVNIKYGKSKRGWHRFIGESYQDGKLYKIGDGFGVARVNRGDSFIVTDSFKTSLHEFIHRIQSIRPDIDKIFQMEHRSRTSGDKVKSLRKLTGKNYAEDELAREDSYAKAYFGKEYISGGALEVMTMSFEYLFSGKERFNKMLNKDDRMIDIVVGVFAEL